MLHPFLVIEAQFLHSMWSNVFCPSLTRRLSLLEWIVIHLMFINFCPLIVSSHNSRCMHWAAGADYRYFIMLTELHGDRLVFGNGCHALTDLTDFNFLGCKNIHLLHFHNAWQSPTSSSSYLSTAWAMAKGMTNLITCYKFLNTFTTWAIVNNSKILNYCACPMILIHWLHHADVHFICGPFSMTSSSDDHLANVKMVVCVPPAISPTCISHPVDFLLQEEGKVEHT